MSEAGYDVCPDGEGWTVYDVVTGDPAVVNGRIQQGLPFRFADDMAELLNEMTWQCSPLPH